MKIDFEKCTNEFLNYDWTLEQMCSFMDDILPLAELYNVDEKDDWVVDTVGAEDANNVRLIRTFYLIYRLADRHAGRLALIKAKYKPLWKKVVMEDGELKLP